jgi:hypothetical protein
VKLNVEYCSFGRVSASPVSRKSDTVYRGSNLRPRYHRELLIRYADSNVDIKDKNSLVSDRIEESLVGKKEMLGRRVETRRLPQTHGV